MKIDYFDSFICVWNPMFKLIMSLLKCIACNDIYVLYIEYCMMRNPF